jgi:hypothetical protein
MTKPTQDHLGNITVGITNAEPKRFGIQHNTVGSVDYLQKPTTLGQQTI